MQVATTFVYCILYWLCGLTPSCMSTGRPGIPQALSLRCTGVLYYVSCLSAVCPLDQIEKNIWGLSNKYDIVNDGDNVPSITTYD